MRVAAEIALSKGERRRLETWASTRSTSVRLRERARIVLMAAEGMTNKAIAAEAAGRREQGRALAGSCCEGGNVEH